MSNYIEKHFQSGEMKAQIHFRHVDWTQERPKMIDALKMLSADQGRGYIIWREGKPYLFAGSYIVRTALFLDDIAKQAEKKGQKLTANRIERIWYATEKERCKSESAELKKILNHTEEEQARIDEARASIEEETEVNPYSAREQFIAMIEKYDLSETDFSLLLETLCKNHQKIRAYIERFRENNKHSGE